MIEGLVHEMRHAAWYHLDLRVYEQINRYTTEEEYIAWKLIEEADAFAIEIEHEIHSRGELGLSQSGAVHYFASLYQFGKNIR